MVVLLALFTWAHHWVKLFKLSIDPDGYKAEYHWTLSLTSRYHWKSYTAMKMFAIGGVGASFDIIVGFAYMKYSSWTQIEFVLRIIQVGTLTGLHVEIVELLMECIQDMS